MIEISEEIISHRRYLARVETSLRQTSDGPNFVVIVVSIEALEEVVPHGRDLARVEASSWKTC